MLKTFRKMQSVAKLPGGWQPRKWSTDGFIKFAVAGVGKKVCNTSGVGGSTKNLAAVTCLAQMLQELQVAKLNILVKELAAHACKTLVITRAYDCTPVLVNLGRYKSQLAPFARYLVKAGDKSSLKSCAEYTSGTGRAIPSFGVIELMGQEVTIHCAATRGLLNHRFIVPPLVLQSQGASAIFEGLERGCPPLCVSKLNALAANLRVLVYSERPDQCSANRRLQMHLAKSLRSNVLIDLGTCAAHAVHRTVVTSYQDEKMTGDVYTIQFVIQVVPHHIRLLRKLREVIWRNLDILDGSFESPNPVHTRHTRAVMEGTLGMKALRSRARVGEEDDVFQTREGALTQRRIDTVCKLLTGDIRQSRVVHHCTRCCENKEACAAKIMSALCEAGFLHSCTAGLPSKGRWGSVAHSNAVQCCGFMCHGLLATTISESFQNREDGDPGNQGEDDAEDHRVQVRRKVWRCKQQVGDPSYQMLAIIRHWCSIEISHLWQVMQHVDAQRDALLRASHPTDSPWRRTFRALVALLSNHVKDTDLAPGFWHFAEQWALALDGPDGKAGASAAFAEARVVVLSQAAQLWWRLLIKYDNYPYKLLRLVDATSTEEQRQRVAADLFDLPKCCLAGDLFSTRATQNSVTV